MHDIPTSQRVGERVRYRMRLSGKNQADLAEQLGISQGSVSSRLRGAVAFDVNELTITANYLGCAPADLLDEAKP